MNPAETKPAVLIGIDEHGDWVAPELYTERHQSAPNVTGNGVSFPPGEALVGTAPRPIVLPPTMGAGGSISAIPENAARILYHARRSLRQGYSAKERLLARSLQNFIRGLQQAVECEL